MKTLNIKLRWNPFIAIALPCLLIIAVSGCEIQKNFEYEPSGSNGVLDINAWEFIQQTDSLSLLEEAIELADMVSYYSGTDARTFITPKNVAFRTYMKTNGYSSIAVVPAETMAGILKYHIVKAEVLFSDPTLISNDPIVYETESGSIMYLSRNSSYQGLINENTKKSWTILTSNIQPTNGVIHITGAIVYLSI